VDTSLALAHPGSVNGLKKTGAIYSPCCYAAALIVAAVFAEGNSLL
jgi:hypothetical protein